MVKWKECLSPIRGAPLSSEISLALARVKSLGERVNGKIK